MLKRNVEIGLVKEVPQEAGPGEVPQPPLEVEVMQESAPKKASKK